MSTLTDGHCLLPNPQTLIGDIDGEIVALHIGSGNYLHLNSSGSFIFSLMDGGIPRSVAWLHGQVMREYAVDSATCHREVDAFLERCIELDLLCIVATDSVAE